MPLSFVCTSRPYSTRNPRLGNSKPRSYCPCLLYATLALSYCANMLDLAIFMQTSVIKLELLFGSQQPSLKASERAVEHTSRRVCPPVGLPSLTRSTSSPGASCGRGTQSSCWCVDAGLSEAFCGSDTKGSEDNPSDLLSILAQMFYSVKQDPTPGAVVVWGKASRLGAKPALRRRACDGTTRG